MKLSVLALLLIAVIVIILLVGSIGRKVYMNLKRNSQKSNATMALVIIFLTMIICTGVYFVLSNGHLSGKPSGRYVATLNTSPTELYFDFEDDTHVSFNYFGHYKASGTYKIDGNTIFLDYKTWDGESYTITASYSYSKSNDTVTIAEGIFAKE